MANLTKVKFYGDELEVTGTCEKDAYVSIRRVCEALGITTQSQLKRLEGKDWATVTFIVTVAEDGKQREHAMIALKSLPLWLVKIEPSRVKAECREKLKRYIKEAADVLAAHFLGIGKPAGGSVPPELLERLAGRVEHIQQQIDRLAAVQMVAPAVHGPLLPRYTVQERLIWKGWPEANKDARKRIRKLAVARIDANFGETPDQAGGPGGGGPLRFYGAQLVYLDQAIDEVREAMLRREAARERITGPTLFSDAG